MKVRRSRKSLVGSCRLMIELNRQFEVIERSHNIQLTDKEKERFRSMICGNVCNGSCQAYYIRIMQ